VEIRNNHNSSIRLEVFDQVPLSKNSDIIISDETIGTGTKNDLTGEVVYQLTITPNQVGKTEIGYTIKFPKNMSIQTKTFRTISAPSF
jgi:hypothetical protein